MEEIELEKLKRLALFGSPAARAAALVLLDQASGGRLFQELEKLKELGGG